MRTGHPSPAGTATPPPTGGHLASLTQSHCVEVHVTQTGEHFGCGQQESLLAGMVRLGKRGIPVGCVNGGCGVCKVRIIEGEVRALGQISAAHVSAEERAQGYTLACRVAPVGPVRLEVCQKLRKPFSLGAGEKQACPPFTKDSHHDNPKET